MMCSMLQTTPAGRRMWHNLERGRSVTCWGWHAVYPTNSRTKWNTRSSQVLLKRCIRTSLLSHSDANQRWHKWEILGYIMKVLIFLHFAHVVVSRKELKMKEECTLWIMSLSSTVVKEVGQTTKRACWSASWTETFVWTSGRKEKSIGSKDSKCWTLLNGYTACFTRAGMRF